MHIFGLAFILFFLKIPDGTGFMSALIPKVHELHQKDDLGPFFFENIDIWPFFVYFLYLTAKTNKSFADTIAHLREVQFFNRTSYWHTGGMVKKIAGGKFHDF